MTRKLAVLAAVAAAFQAAPARAVVPQVLTYSGYLKTSAGAPVTTLTNLTFRLYAAPTGGAALWTETVSTSPSPDGWFSVVLGTTSPLPLADLGNDVYLGIQFESEAEFAQRARLTPSHAAIAVDWTRVTNRPGACTAGQFLTGYDASGTALCATPPGGSTGGVSSVVGGDRITATGTGAVTVSLTGCPAANQILQWSGAAWACIPTPTPVGGGVSSVQVQQPLINTGTATAPNLGLTNTCGNGQILKWSSGTSTWACGNDNDTTNPGTVTSVAPAGTAGNPVTVANGTGAAAIDIAPAGAGTSGYLRATDWSAFNAKLTPPSGCAAGDVITWDVGTSQFVCRHAISALNVFAPLGGSFGGGSADIFIQRVTPFQDGYLTREDYIRFDTKLAGIAPGPGIQVDALTDPQNPLVEVRVGPGLTVATGRVEPLFAGAGGNFGSSSDLARADHAHPVTVQVPALGMARFGCAIGSAAGTVAFFSVPTLLLPEIAGAACPQGLAAASSDLTVPPGRAGRGYRVTLSVSSPTGHIADLRLNTAVERNGAVACNGSPTVVSTVGGAKQIYRIDEPSCFVNGDDVLVLRLERLSGVGDLAVYSVSVTVQ